MPLTLTTSDGGRNLAKDLDTPATITHMKPTRRPRSRLLPITTRVPPDLYAAFSAGCEAENVSMAATLRTLAAHWVEAQKTSQRGKVW